MLTKCLGRAKKYLQTPGPGQGSANTFAATLKIVLNSRDPSISGAYNFMENTSQLNLNFKTTVDSSIFHAQSCMKLST